ncbi:MAG: 2-hydroxyglutaryl-CoA dehydratase [Candidatus Thermoplasmatota archaeon]|nr:2-hydroxyglutaryl-CoA dehydratase [Candidatus Thermoplasmatota archaeon]
MSDGEVKKGPYDLGIDVGAISTKLLLLKDGNVAGTTFANTSMEPGKMARKLMNELLRDRGSKREEIGYVIATGQGRKSVDFADMARTEITTFARGANRLMPDVEVVVDIGGHGIRVMKVGEMGIVSDFRTNDKCSSGTGCFMDTMAMALEVQIDDVGERSLRSKVAEHVNATCTVFAESEVVSLIARGKATEDILAGLHQMVARKIVALVNSTQSKGKVLVCGGVARNKGIVEELRKIMNREMVVPEMPHMVGALGAALMAPRSANKVKLEAPAMDDGEAKVERTTFLDRLLRWKT